MTKDRLSPYHTTWYEGDEHGGVTYHSTNIVSWKDNKVTLNSDGWETVTTKRKMNQASKMFCLGYSVFQKDFEWFVNLPNGETVPFKDNMTFERVA